MVYVRVNCSTAKMCRRHTRDICAKLRDLLNICWRRRRAPPHPKHAFRIKLKLIIFNEKS